MSVGKSIVIFIISFLLFVVALIPVGVIVNQLPLPKKVSYQGLSGSVWNGKVNAIQVDKFLLENMQWQFNLSSLLRGNLGFDIKFGNAREKNQLSGSGLASTGLSGHQLQNFVFRMPAEKIKPMLPIPVGVVEGRLITSVDIFEFGQPVCEQLSGKFVWVKSGTDINGPISFGTITSTLLCEDNKLVAKFDGENLLGLEGSAVIESSSKFNFDGFVKPDVSLPAVVHQGISMFGKIDSKGKYKIAL